MNKIFRVDAVVGDPGWASLQSSVKTLALGHVTTFESAELKRVIQGISELEPKFRELSWTGRLTVDYKNGTVTVTYPDINIISDEGDAFEMHLRSLTDLFNKLNKLDRNKDLGVSFEITSVSRK